jgi:hypothetical protein
LEKKCSWVEKCNVIIDIENQPITYKNYSSHPDKNKERWLYINRLQPSFFIMGRERRGSEVYKVCKVHKVQMVRIF